VEIVFTKPNANPNEGTFWLCCGLPKLQGTTMGHRVTKHVQLQRPIPPAQANVVLEKLRRHPACNQWSTRDSSDYLPEWLSQMAIPNLYWLDKVTPLPYRCDNLILVRSLLYCSYQELLTPWQYRRISYSAFYFIANVNRGTLQI
jgi:hypothetical protein